MKQAFLTSRIFDGTGGNYRSDIGILNAIDAGVDTIEHGNFLDEEAAQRMVAGGQVLVPTLSPFYRMTQLGTAGGIPEYAARDYSPWLKPRGF